jgi:hypothetical protein
LHASGRTRNQSLKNSQSASSWAEASM